jgi:hypothetical protein
LTMTNKTPTTSISFCLIILSSSLCLDCLSVQTLHPSNLYIYNVIFEHTESFLTCEMGVSQSQEVSRFISNNVNTSAISNIISQYATETNAIVTNVQDLCVNITASGNIDFGQGGFTGTQEIQSMIDIQTLIDRVDREKLVNDLQTTVSNELKSALDRTSSVLDIFSIPSNQRLREEIIQNLNMYVNQTINLQTIDQVLINASNIQNGCYNFVATNITGPITITQKIQADTMASNIIKQVVDRAIENKEFQAVTTTSETTLTAKNTGIGSIIWYIIGGLVLLAAIVIPFLIPSKTSVKILIAAIGIVVGIVIIGIGIFLARSKSQQQQRVGKKK